MDEYIRTRIYIYIYIDIYKYVYVYSCIIYIIHTRTHIYIHLDMFGHVVNKVNKYVICYVKAYRLSNFLNQ